MGHSDILRYAILSDLETLQMDLNMTYYLSDLTDLLGYVYRENPEYGRMPECQGTVQLIIVVLMMRYSYPECEDS